MSAIDVIQEARADLAGLLAEVLGSVLREEIVPACAGAIEDGPGVGARVGVQDADDGGLLLIELRMEIMMARFLAGHMMASSEPRVEDVLDAVGELGNIVGGNVKSLLPGACRLSLPSAALYAHLPERPAGAVVARACVLGQAVELAVAEVPELTGLYWPGAPRDRARGGSEL